MNKEIEFCEVFETHHVDKVNARLKAGWKLINTFVHNTEVDPNVYSETLYYSLGRPIGIEPYQDRREP